MATLTDTNWSAKSVALRWNSQTLKAAHASLAQQNPQELLRVLLSLVHVRKALWSELAGDIRPLLEYCVFPASEGSTDGAKNNCTRWVRVIAAILLQAGNSGSGLALPPDAARPLPPAVLEALHPADALIDEIVAALSSPSTLAALTGSDRSHSSDPPLPLRRFLPQESSFLSRELLPPALAGPNALPALNTSLADHKVRPVPKSSATVAPPPAAGSAALTLSATQARFGVLNPHCAVKIPISFDMVIPRDEAGEEEAAARAAARSSTATSAAAGGSGGTAPAATMTKQEKLDAAAAAAARATQALAARPASSTAAAAGSSLFAAAPRPVGPRPIPIHAPSSSAAASASAGMPATPASAAATPLTPATPATPSAIAAPGPGQLYQKRAAIKMLDLAEANEALDSKRRKLLVVEESKRAKEQKEIDRAREKADALAKKAAEKEAKEAEKKAAAEAKEALKAEKLRQKEEKQREKEEKERERADKKLQAILAKQEKDEAKAAAAAAKEAKAAAALAAKEAAAAAANSVVAAAAGGAGGSSASASTAAAAAAMNNAMTAAAVAAGAATVPTDLLTAMITSPNDPSVLARLAAWTVDLAQKAAAAGVIAPSQQQTQQTQPLQQPQQPDQTQPLFPAFPAALTSGVTPSFAPAPAAPAVSSAIAPVDASMGIDEFPPPPPLQAETTAQAMDLSASSSSAAPSFAVAQALPFGATQFANLVPGITSTLLPLQAAPHCAAVMLDVPPPAAVAAAPAAEHAAHISAEDVAKAAALAAAASPSAQRVDAAAAAAAEPAPTAAAPASAAPVAAPAPVAPVAAVAPGAPADASTVADSIFAKSNRCTPEEREMIIKFLNHVPFDPPFGAVNGQYSILLHEEDSAPDPSRGGAVAKESTYFEMTLDTGAWRKVKKRKIKKATAQAAVAPAPVAPAAPHAVAAPDTEMPPAS